jgi:GMP synthase (glutamine-hydrolysing)
VGRNPLGREIGTVELRAATSAAGDALLSPLAERTPFHATHVESVLALPPGAVLLGESALDPRAAFRVGERAWGIQFHPEFDADVMRGYLAERFEILRAEGLDPEALLREVRDTPAGPALLARFAALVRDAEVG